MKKCIAMLIVVTFLAGCGNKSVAESKKEAHERWNFMRAKVMYGLAEERFAAGDLDEARDKAADAITRSERFIPARILLGKIYIEQGHYALACREFEQALEVIPRNSEVLFLMGVAQEKQGLIEEALVNYRLSHAMDNGNMDAVMAAAEVLASDGRIRQAQLYIESYMDIAGAHAGMYEIAGRLAMIQKQYEQASGYYQKAADIAPDNVHYSKSLAKAHYHTGQYAKAAEALKTLMRSDDFEPAGWADAMLGDCYMQTGKFEPARRSYLLATRRNADDAKVWTNLAKAALALDDLPRTIVASRRAIELDGDLQDAKLLLGYALLRDGQVTAALKALSDAVGQHPDSAELHCVLGRAYDEAGNSAAANKCYDQAVRVEPESVLARELASQSDLRQGISVNID